MAFYFEREHFHVLRDIDALIADGHPDMDGLMFQQLSAFNPNANRETRHFLMNRDGFALLAMGFTGEKALRFKLAFLRRPSLFKQRRGSGV